MTSNTTYYVRAYATNTSGTSYGNETSFTTSLAAGSVYGGGIIGYILVSGDAGYDANVQHGFIVSSNNLLTPNNSNVNPIGATWGCAASVAGTLSTLGSGANNTALIIASNCATANTAAKLCDNYSVTVNGTTYSDWFLPSPNELRKFYDNRTAIGNFGGVTCQVYASSAELPSVPANYYTIYVHESYPGQFSNALKTDISGYVGVRAVRSF